MPASNKKRSIGNDDTCGNRCIELFESFRELRKSWPKDMGKLLDPALPSDRRAELWEMMCEGGDMLRQRFAWAIPDDRALRILKHFSPIVEVGSGLGYWAMLLRARGADVRAYDKVGGAPHAGISTTKRRSKAGGVKDSAARGDSENGRGDAEEGEGLERSFWTEVEEGGPDALEEPCNEHRSLLLCYPDDFEGGETESLGLRCLHSFEGDIVIHVGELFGDSVGMTPGQAPWGRTTSRECQEELASKFHCILKVPIPSWPHSRDTLTVWKRHAFSVIHYGEDEEDDEEEEEKLENVRGRKAELGGDGAVAAASGSLSKAGAPGGGDGVEEEDASEEDRNSDGGSVGGFLDVDTYAFVPAAEEISSAQAAPCVRFLLDPRG